ncbi:hypothetical protein GOP47_0002528 [Adiantum capillus-veneris]|uniref:Uncharacterized protein n=1 Tax=Adiantum capillus-veneris TaxID=13818 RepID=A0A9D4VA95_ADICA|nr:hypothetical protein GOP47_0002528 [Adiantum capillus-veneris]
MVNLSSLPSRLVMVQSMVMLQLCDNGQENSGQHYILCACMRLKSAGGSDPQVHTSSASDGDHPQADSGGSDPQVAQIKFEGSRLAFCAFPSPSIRKCI